MRVPRLSHNHMEIIQLLRGASSWRKLMASEGALYSIYSYENNKPDLQFY